MTHEEREFVLDVLMDAKVKSEHAAKAYLDWDKCETGIKVAYEELSKRADHAWNMVFRSRFYEKGV